MNLNLADIGKFAFNPKVENFDEMEDSFFKDVYLSAEKCIEDILKQNSSEKRNEAISGKKDDTGAERSNIVAFTGGRGSGKTSAMLSVANLLKVNKKIDGSVYQDIDKFIVLDMIEPSNITAQETVTDVVLSRIYTRFEQERDKRIKKGEDNEISQEDTRKVFRTFDDAYQAVRMACRSREKRYDLPSGLEGLANTAAGNRLRKLIKDMVEATLSGLKNRCNDNNRSYFILCVDDVDMNIRQGYEICEDLRKFFNIPGFIILFSLNTDQMNDVVKQRYIIDFKTLLESNDGSKTSESIPYMAAKYMEKLIPIGRRCALPDMRIINPKTIKIKDKSPDHSIVDEIFIYLFQKTGLILMKNDFGSHGFIPTSLRSAMHLLHLLESMAEVKLFPEEEEEIEDRNDAGKKKKARIFKFPDLNSRIELAKNLESLLYYIHEYDINIIDSADSAVILKQLSTWPLVTLNKHIFNMLFDALEKKGANIEKLKTLQQLTDQNTPAQSVTMGDLFFVARFYAETAHRSDTNGHFFALFRIIYSIRILQCFFIEEYKEAGLKSAKNQLFIFLGGLFYLPLFNNVVRGGDWYTNLALETLNSFENEKEYNDLLDTISLGAVCIGTTDDSDLINEWNKFRSEHSGAYYSDVSRENLMGTKGHTYKSFAYSYLGFVLNPLRDNLTLSNSKYNNWLKKYISPLPIFSADFMDYYVQKLFEKSENARKSGKPIHQAIWEGTMALISDLMDESQIPEKAKPWFNLALSEFACIDTDVILKLFFDKEDERQQGSIRRQRLIPIKPRIPKSESERIYQTRLRVAHSKYIGLQRSVSFKYLQDSQGVNLTRIDRNSIERTKGEKLNEQIRAIKADFFAVRDPSEIQYNEVVNQIIKLIDAELRSIGS